jgi:ATP-dependent DNA ligase
MEFAIEPPLPPMEALSVDTIPVGPDWQYEPKWDGFRCLLFREGDRTELQSKSCKSLSRYFPEVLAAARALPAARFVVDGELAVPQGDGFSFDALLQRIHPAPSRIALLARHTPALVVIFDLLADEEGRVLLDRPLRERRQRLEEFARTRFLENAPFRLSPATTQLREAKRWLERVGSALDGIVAKRVDLPYRSSERTGMQKIKRYRSADCVVGGFRFNEGKRVVGSLLLGLYDEEGLLNHVGFTSTLRQAEKAELTARLMRLVAPPGFTGGKPGGPSRWSTRRSAEWQPLKPKLVVEVGYDHFSGGRFRHGTQLLRWRPDKAPRQCTIEQVQRRSSGMLRLLAKPRGKRRTASG